MNYFYLKNGDVVGPKSAQEIAKDELFAKDTLVCPEDKAEQAEFWKAAQDYQDFDFACKTEEESPLPQEAKSPVQEEQQEQELAIAPLPKEESSALPQYEKATITQKAETGDKNPFETDRPQITPKIEDTLSSHVIAPRLDANGDTLLEDIPAKAILDSGQEQAEQDTEDFKEVTASLQEVIEEDTPIVNIFEGPLDQEKNKTRDFADISENIYNTYGSQEETKHPLKIKTVPQNYKEHTEHKKKNNKIYLLLLIMFILLIVAFVLALFGPDTQAQQSKKELPVLPAQTESPLQDNYSTKQEEPIDAPTTDAAAFFKSVKTNASDQEKALAKVKRFVLSGGNTVGEYLNKRYAGYQINWEANILSGRNYYVHFNASKIRQEPIVYSFSIDLDKNEISGLNNLGMDLLVKGE